MLMNIFYRSDRESDAAGGILGETLQSELLFMIKIYTKLKVNYTCKIWLSDRSNVLLKCQLKVFICTCKELAK